MLIKEIVVGLITILENGVLQIREDTVVLEDGVEISRTYFRYVLEPGDDVSQKDPKIQLVAEVVWTQEVIDARKAVIAATPIPGI